MPRLMDLYNAHPRSLASQREKCVVCHTRADGSGKLTPFGHKYEEAGLEFTDVLMKAYPNVFASAPAAGAANAAPSASPLPKGPSVPSQGPGGIAGPPIGGVEKTTEWSAQAYFRQECQNCHGKYGDGDPMGGVPPIATKAWIAERLPKADELVKIILDGKAKMIGHRGKIDEAQARKLYDLMVEIAKKNAS